MADDINVSAPPAPPLIIPLSTRAVERTEEIEASPGTVPDEVEETGETVVEPTGAAEETAGAEEK